VNSADATATKLSFDLWYLRHRSLTVDLAILLRTVFAVVRGDRPAVRSAPRAQQPAIEAAEPDPAG
jgi:lipopolysaccharide/colanic/teichoic acid biosynthesis glycosyltransferase